MGSMFVGWLLALVLGMRHASEPDHLAAVSIMLTEQSGPRQGALLGAYWGVGHSASLLVVGGSFLVLRSQMPGYIADMFELVVAAMLLVLGARSVMRAVRIGRSGFGISHAHGGLHHVHVGPEDHVHLGPWSVARRPLLVGLVHGMAGSGALTALALANMPSLGSGLVYMLLFGLGSVAGMAVLTGFAGWPLRLLARRAGIQVGLSVVAGASSLALGVLWGWPLLWRLTDSKGATGFLH